MLGPIRPDQVVPRKASQIPERVFEVFNDLIARNWNGDSATVLQEEVVKHLEAEDFTRERIYEERMLDVEDAYRAEGWTVVYSKPAYNETYGSFFRFSKS